MTAKQRNLRGISIVVVGGLEDKGQLPQGRMIDNTNQCVILMLGVISLKIKLRKL